VALALAGCGGGGGQADAQRTALKAPGSGEVAAAEAGYVTVPKATCGPGSNPETALQGQVPAAVRAAGFKGYSCNLELVGQSKNEGGSWLAAYYQQGSKRKCAYYDSSSAVNIPGTQTPRATPGVAVIDASDAANPVATTFLTTTAMLDPWESLKVNERRKMLGAVNARNGNGGPQIDLYDLSGDCRYPQLLTDASVGLDDGTGQYLAAVRGHEGNFSPDGMTFYAANLGAGYIYPIDISNPAKPRLLTQYFTTVGRVHGLSVSEDGQRAYVAIAGRGLANRTPAGSPPNNGFQILDVSQVDKRIPNPEMKVVGEIYWDDGSTAQHTIPVRIKGKPYVINVDEGGSGGSGTANWQAACNLGLPAWPFARIIDVSDETKPTITSKLILEAYDPKNCSQVIPDLVGLSAFTYGSHYCSVDNIHNATTLACGYFNSGIRVFDIREPAQPKEIAYFNPAGTTTASPGSNHVRPGGWIAGNPDWCSAQIHLDAQTGTLQTMCQDNGFLSLKFTNGVWPFPGTSTPPGMQN
jgi:hypothetical protein